MRELDLNYCDELRSKITEDGHWKKHKARFNKNMQFDRVDVYSGPEIPETAKVFGAKPVTTMEHKQICHFHPVTPQLYEKNLNWENDAEFIVNAPRIYDFLRNKIKELEGK